MNADSRARRTLSLGLWAAVLVALYLVISQVIVPNSEFISLDSKRIISSITEIGRFVILVFGGLALVEIYLYLLFYRKPANTAAAVLVRLLEGLIALVILMGMVVFLSDIGGLFELGEGAVGKFFRYPMSQVSAFSNLLVESEVIEKGYAGALMATVVAAITLIIFGIIFALTKPRHTRLGLAYLLITPALIGIAFLMIYPFMFEIRLAFSNASLGTQATKNAEYSLLNGWINLKTLFTGNVAKDAKFFDVFFRTILWTAINVTFHVGGGMGLALLLNRPMKLQGVYRTLLIFPWAIPTTIAAMALRNEFDSRYGVFNIVLGNIQTFFEGLSDVFIFGNGFAWLGEHIGPVSWKQDPFWAFISVLMTNIWLGIPFMSVVILGGLQSISTEYYEAAEIDGASKWQQFRNITLPLLRPVLTPVIILGTVWTFNKFDVIYLITQGGPQEKTDILVSSMYKAAFMFYRYGFTAMFALVIFIILLTFSLFYIRVSGGFKTAYD